ncbi:Phosphomannomutase [Cercospora zeina]
MIKLVAFDLDGTLAISKQPIQEPMAQALSTLLRVSHVAIISGGDWPQFSTQIASRLPASADLSKLWLMPTSGTKLYRFDSGTNVWKTIYADLFTPETKQSILEAFEQSLEVTGFKPAKTWGENIEDRGSQITFSALGQEAPISEKEVWDPEFVKRKVIQADLKTRLPELSINMGGTTSIDVTKMGVDKAYGMRRLSEESGIGLDEMVFMGDAIFPGGNDFPVEEMGVKTVRVENPKGTLAAIEGVVACLT